MQPEMLHNIPRVAQEFGASMDLQIPLARARADLPELCRRVQDDRARIVLTKYGAPIAALVPVDEVSELQPSLALVARRTPRRRHAAR